MNDFCTDFVQRGYHCSLWLVFLFGHLVLAETPHHIWSIPLSKAWILVRVSTQSPLRLNTRSRPFLFEDHLYDMKENSAFILILVFCCFVCLFFGFLLVSF